MKPWFDSFVFGAATPVHCAAMQRRAMLFAAATPAGRGIISPPGGSRWH